MRRTTLVAIAGVCAAAGSAAGQYTFSNLGAGASPTGISADGSVVAGTNASQYFRWTPGGGVVTIGGTAPGVGGAGGQAKISDDGRYIAGTAIDPTNNLYTMSRYDAVSGQWTNLPSLGATSGQSTSSAWGISGDGNTVVGLGWVNAGTANAISWQANSNITTSLGTSVAGRSTRANATNSDGSVIAGWQDSSTGFRQAAVWSGGAQTLLTAPNGNPLSEAGDVSSNGQWVVGGSNASATAGQPWRWSQATGTEILTSIFNPSWSGSGTGIADNGWIVGFMRPFGPALFGEGFIWFPGQGMVNLTDYARSIGVPIPTGTVLSLPLAISADGLTISGQGRSSTGAIGWVITIPAPGASMLLALGGVAALRRKR